MASDLQMTQSGMIKWKAKTKMYKFKAHPDTYPHCDFIMGFAGTAGDMVALADYFDNPEGKPPKMEAGLNGLVLTEQGSIFVFTNPGRWIGVDEPYAVIGSGSVFALGAMAAGATVKEAVKAAMKLDPFSGMGVKQLSW